MAISRLFLEPFKWKYLEFDRAKLGSADGLISECLDSESFWKGLHSAHAILKKKYPCVDTVDHRLEQEIQKVQQAINERYRDIINIKMPYGLEDLWDRDSIAAYTSERGTML